MGTKTKNSKRKIKQKKPIYFKKRNIINKIEKSTFKKSSDAVSESKIKEKIDELSKGIRKKYLALKLGKAENDVTLEKIFKPIIMPIQQMVVQHNKENGSIKKDTRYEKVTSTNQDDEYEEQFKHMEQLQQPQQLQHDVGVVHKGVEAVGAVHKGVTDDDDYDGYEDVEDKNISVYTDEYLNNYPELARQYLNEFSHDKKYFDTTYGVAYDSTSDKWVLGKSVINFIDNSDFIIENKRFKGTKGLYELIFKKHPQNYSTSDKQNYREILQLTNVHKRNFDPSAYNRGNKSHKYREIIKPLTKKFASGTGHRTYKNDSLNMLTYNNKPIEYIYWDDINELVDRLRLLVASKDAGNTSHDNEITAIINELKEAKVIY